MLRPMMRQITRHFRRWFLSERRFTDSEDISFRRAYRRGGDKLAGRVKRNQAGVKQRV